MSFLGLVFHNLRIKVVRSSLTAVAVAVAVAAVVTLAVIGTSLHNTAADLFNIGKANFVVAQADVSDINYSNVDEKTVTRISSMPGVTSAVGVLVNTTRVGSNQLFVVMGVPANQLGTFGVKIVAGRAYTPGASNEVMLGSTAAQVLSKSVGDHVTIDPTYKVVGIFSSGRAAADSGAMFPLAPFQSYERENGVVSMVYVKTAPGTDVAALRRTIENQSPGLTTIASEAEFGRADRNLATISAAQTGSTVLALLIGAVIVMDAMLLSFVERVREFGILSAVGWSRTRVVSLVFGEAIVLAVVGAAVGVGLSVLVVLLLQHVGPLVGLLHANYSGRIFADALYTGLGMALLGAAYPAVRAALVQPLKALSHE